MVSLGQTLVALWRESIVRHTTGSACVLGVTLKEVLAYLVVFLSCCIPPLTHHSSSHLPPLPPVSLSPFLCAHISVFPTCLRACFSFSTSVLILPHTLLLLPKALPRPGFCCCNDTDKLFGHSFGFGFSLFRAPLPVLSIFPCKFTFM